MSSAMATTGLSSVSRMHQLHELHRLACWTPSMAPSPHPCKLAFIFFPRTHLRPLSSAPSCCHGELGIFSVKELVDGFLHFFLGTPNKTVDNVSSSRGEHVAKNLCVPKRLPSKFSKKLPIPVAVVRRKRQEKRGPKEGSMESSRETIKPSLRPKSSFLKRSPIPIDRRENLFVNGNVSNGKAVQDENSMPRGSKGVSLPESKHARPASMFVRNSPIPPLSAQFKKRHATLSETSDFSPTEVCKDLPAVQATSSTGLSVRPKSSFSRRSPVAKDQNFSKHATGTSKPPPPILLGTRKMTGMEVSAQSEYMTEESPPLIDLGKCKLSELKNLAKLKGVKGYSKLKKAELLDVLKNLDI